MTSIKNIFTWAAIVSLVGCGSAPVTHAMKSAVLTEPSPDTTQVLNQAVSRALNGTQVSLARNVLIDSSELQLERRTQSSTQGLNGSLMGLPKVYRFSLKQNNSGECFLVYSKTGQEYRLDGVKCKTL
jgi:hypothetical protein